MQPISGRRLAVAIVSFNAVSLVSVGVEPIVAAQLGTQLGLPEHRVGEIVAAEFAGSMLASFPAVAWVRYVSARRIAILAGLLFLVCNLASAHYLAYAPLLIWRALAGVAEGTLLILTLAAAASTSRPAQLYAWWVVGQTVVGTLGLALFPQLAARFGLSALYVAMAVGIALVLPLAGAFRSDRPAVVYDANPDAVPPAGRLRIAAQILTVLFLYYLVAGGVWAFAGDRGAQVSIAPGRVGWVLGLSYFVSLAGAALAAWFGTQQRCRQLAIVGHLGLAAAMLPFAGGAGLYMFAIFAIALQVSWAFTAPLLMTLLAQIEPPGSMMAAGTFVVGAGLTLGPLAAGRLFELTRGPIILAVSSAAIAAASAVLLNRVPAPTG